jgi:hypothetical protein
MSERPTPETEKIKGALHTNWDDLLAHARKLERERDVARRQCLQWLEEWHLTDRVRCDMKSERDEAREALASREVVIAQQRVITDLILERDQARAVLQEIEAARWHTACELRRIATRALGNLTISTK